MSVIQPGLLTTDMQILRSSNTESNPYPDLPERKLDWDNTKEVCKIISKVIGQAAPRFSYQIGPYSEKIANNFHKKNSYQNALIKYQQYFLIFDLSK